MALSDVELLKLARRYQLTQIEISTRSATAVGKAWDRLGGLDDAALVAFRDTAVAVVQQAVTAAAALTEAYITQYSALADGEAVALIGTAQAVTIRGGVPLAEVYGRPTVLARVAISNGSSFVEAMSFGRARAVQLADTDPMLAAREAARNTMDRIPRVVGYRRVPDGNACEFCQIAATQRYTRGDLMPIHPGCHCSIAPIIGSKDPGHIIGREAHAQLKASGALSQRSLENYTRLEQLVTLRSHPELGPVLQAV